MIAHAQNLLLMLGGIGFSLFILAKLLSGLSARNGESQAARRRMLEGKRRGSDRALPAPERVEALQHAARIALEVLHRPGLAAALARRAERLDPRQADTLGLLVIALQRGKRYAALERLLWRQLADDPDPSGPNYRRAFDELLALYEGPLARPETARALRRFQAA